MSNLPPPSRPEPPAVDAPRTGAALPPPRPAVPEPVFTTVPATATPLTQPPVVTPPVTGHPSAVLAPPAATPLAAPAPARSFSPPAPLPDTSVDLPLSWTPFAAPTPVREPTAAPTAPAWPTPVAAPPPEMTAMAPSALSAPPVLAEAPVVTATSLAPPAPASATPTFTPPTQETVVPVDAEPMSPEPPAAAPSIWDDIDLGPVPWAAEETPAVDPWTPLHDDQRDPLPSIDGVTGSVESDEFFDDDGSQEDRSEIEALIAAAEAEAAERSGGAPLVFAEPEGVDLAAIVASQPQEPPRPVMDLTSPGADSPAWLSDLVGSIEEGDDEPSHNTEEVSSVFVSADTVIRAKPARVTTNPFAVLALLASLVWVCGLGSLVGIVFGVVALVQISSVHQRGRILALAGLLLGVVGMTAALTLFVFDSDETDRTVISDPPAFGEVVVTSCALDASGRAAAVVRVVNVTADPATYALTVAFQAGDTRAVATVESSRLDPGGTELITAVSDATFTEAPVCLMQDTLRYVEPD